VEIRDYQAKRVNIPHKGLTSQGTMSENNREDGLPSSSAYMLLVRWVDIFVENLFMFRFKAKENLQRVGMSSLTF